MRKKVQANGLVLQAVAGTYEFMRQFSSYVFRDAA